MRFWAGKSDSRQFERAVDMLHRGLQRLRALASPGRRLWPAGLRDFLEIANNSVDVAGACDNLGRHWLATALASQGAQGWDEAGLHFALGLGVDPIVDVR